MTGPPNAEDAGAVFAVIIAAAMLFGGAIATAILTWGRW